MNRDTEYVVKNLEHTVFEVAYGMTSVDLKEVQKSLRALANQITKDLKDEEKSDKKEELAVDANTEVVPTVDTEDVAVPVDAEPIVMVPKDEN